LLLKSFVRLRAVDPGFISQNVAAMTVDLPGSVYPTAAQIQTFHEQTLTRLADIPGATASGAVNWLPLGGPLLRGDFHVQGRSTPDGLLADKLCVSPGYFRTMGIRLLRGRDFAASDRADAPGVAIISRSVAQAVWSNEDPVGQRIAVASKPGPGDWLTIVGVVDDVKQVGPASASHPALYQVYWQVGQTGFLRHMTFVVRTASEPRPVMPAMRGALRDVDKTLPPQAILPMTDLLETWTAEPAFETRLLAVFAALALGLALVGIYGVLAYSVAQSTREIGIRMALGAAAFEVVAMILRRTLIFVGVGVTLGLLTALGLTRVLRGFLFDIRPNDPATFVWVAVLVLGATMVAAWLPARRAARVNPTIALREE
jgi:putative ABC transport system permease protein